MNDDWLTQYSRQILLPEVDLEGQQQLQKTSVMILGVGGLGSNLAMILARAGVGQLRLVDYDRVERSNLPRQLLYTEAQLDLPKVQAAKQQIENHNPDCEVSIRPVDIAEHFPDELLDGVKIIFDCTDNYNARCTINRIAVSHQLPLIAATAVRLEGQLMTFLNQGGACYECLTTQRPIQDTPCREVGVLNSQVMLMASLQAQKGLKYLLSWGDFCDGHLLMVDGVADHFQSFTIKKRSDCPACSTP